MFKTAIAVVIAVAAAAGPATAPERADDAMNARIRAEETDHSQIMRTTHYLTDVYGPRLTGSPNHKAAAEWTLKQMTEWGFTNAHLEPWNFGHPGWLNERFSGFIVSPVKDSLVGEVLGWTPSTRGTASGEAVQNRPTSQSDRRGAGDLDRRHQGHRREQDRPGGQGGRRPGDHRQAAAASE